MSGLPSVRDLAELVRLPASLTVPGDAWSGSAWYGEPAGGRAAAMPLGSVLLYSAGMALNDWADREVDALERPERVIPSGRVTPTAALGLAGALGAAGIAVTALAGGRRALRVSVPLAALVATYDLLAKDSPAGPFVMASTRGLDVVLGAAASPTAAVAPALAATVHTAGVTTLSRGEVHGTNRVTAGAALAATGTAAALMVAATLRDADVRPRDRWASHALATAYVARVGRAQAAAYQRPDGPTARAATGAGIGGITLLQAAWLTSRGRYAAAAAVAGAGPLLRRTSRAVSPT